MRIAAPPPDLRAKGSLLPVSLDPGSPREAREKCKDLKLEARILYLSQWLTKLGTGMVKSQGRENIGPENVIPRL